MKEAFGEYKQMKRRNELPGNDESDLRNISDPNERYALSLERKKIRQTTSPMASKTHYDEKKYPKTVNMKNRKTLKAHNLYDQGW